MVCVTLGVQEGAPAVGDTPTERDPECNVSVRLVLPEPARFYTVRAITTHRMHAPSDELQLVLHTKVALIEPSFSRLGGPDLAYPLAVNLTAYAPAENPADNSAVVLR